MRAVILVGGFGTRLRPLTLTVPKQMLPVVDAPMIEHVVGWLARHGIDDAVLSLGYRPDAFVAAYPDDRCRGVHLHYAVEPEPLDTAGAVRFAARDAGIDSAFVVVNGDVLTDLDLTSLVAMHRNRSAQATIALTPVDDPSRYGVVPTDADGRVEAFIEKPPAHEAPCNWINAGTYVLQPEVLDRIPTGRRVSIERETFPGLVADGSLFALRSEAYWVDAGTPASYLQAQLDLIDGVRGAPLRAIDPSAVIDEEAMVEHSVVLGGAVVERGASVVDSIILGASRVGAGAKVERSIVGPGSQVGSGATLTGLTVLGERVRVEAGSVLDAQRIPNPT